MNDWQILATYLAAGAPSSGEREAADLLQNCSTFSPCRRGCVWARLSLGHIISKCRQILIICGTFQTLANSMNLTEQQ